MVIIAVGFFVFFIYFGTFIQHVFNCTYDVAFNVSVSVTGLGLAALIIALM